MIGMVARNIANGGSEILCRSKVTPLLTYDPRLLVVSNAITDFTRSYALKVVEEAYAHERRHFSRRLCVIQSPLDDSLVIHGYFRCLLLAR